VVFRGTENNNQNNFDASGNLLHLDNIANLDSRFKEITNWTKIGFY
jgi:insecticidal toxin complex protein TccC